MKSLVVKRSVVIDGHKTSVSLEDAFWSNLKEIAHTQQVTLSEVVTKIDKGRQAGNLSSAIRLFVFDQVRTHGDLWRYSRSRRSGEEDAQINALPVQSNGRTNFSVSECLVLWVLANDLLAGAEVGDYWNIDPSQRLRRPIWFNACGQTYGYWVVPKQIQAKVCPLPALLRYSIRSAGGQLVLLDQQNGGREPVSAPRRMPCGSMPPVPEKPRCPSAYNLPSWRDGACRRFEDGPVADPQDGQCRSR